MISSISALLGEFVVVETTDTAYLGALERLDDGHVLVRTGLRGRPPVLALDEIVEVTLASKHPDVAG
ncbi:MAG: hypothetical protein NVS3B26_17570 [Mycobacteriales bacterium]